MRNIFFLSLTVFLHTTLVLQATGFVVRQKCQNIEYTVNEELRTQAYNPTWYQTISRELDTLIYTYGKTNNISFGQQQTQQQAPTLYRFLRQKVDGIIQRIDMSIPSLSICIKPFDRSKPEEAYNAHAHTCIQKQILYKQLVRSDGKVLKSSVDEKTTAFHDLVFNEETIRLMAWHEGTDQLPLKEGVFDGLIAHELAHIVCGHDGSCIQNELEADSLGATFILNRSHVFEASTMLLTAGALYGMLLQMKNKYAFDSNDMLNVTQVLMSSLTKHVINLGFFSESATYEDLYKRVAHALYKASHRIETHHVGASRIVQMSLIYDELKDISKTRTFLSNVEITCTSSGPRTHPAPELRKKCVLARLER